jgi:5-carboxymethyl-2-hydroxymuconate isomerase
MPHCVIEHSAKFDSYLVMEKVFAGALQSKLFEEDGSDIKVRASVFEHFITGNSQADFIHVSLNILSGRSAAQKAQLSETVLQQLAALAIAPSSISVAVVDIDRASYRKLVR